jgi:hypothetical protein
MFIADRGKGKGAMFVVYTHGNRHGGETKQNTQGTTNTEHVHASTLKKQTASQFMAKLCPRTGAYFGHELGSGLLQNLFTPCLLVPSVRTHEEPDNSILSVSFYAAFAVGS